MAITATNIGSDLILVMDNGVGSSGQTLSKNRTYSSVKATAMNEDIYSVAQTLLGLQSGTNLAIERRNLMEIASE